MYSEFTSRKYALRLGLVAVAVLAVALVAGVSVAAAAHKCDQGEVEGDLLESLAFNGKDCETAGHNQPRPDPDKPPFFDCGKKPYLWNPFSQDYQRRFIKWCEPYTFDENEVLYNGLMCDETPLFEQGLCQVPY